MSSKTLLTVEDFERLVLPEDKRYELDEGELVEMTFPSFLHNRIAKRIIKRLDAFVEAHSLGEVFIPDAGYALSEHTLRGPDVSFVREGRLKEFDLLHSRFKGAPDLAVEVVSPSDTARDLPRRVRQYLDAGTSVVWVVYPESKEIHVFGAKGDVRVLHEGDDLEAPELLPGFSVAVREIFAGR
jgi:Uma2 family endonuclease